MVFAIAHAASLPSTAPSQSSFCSRGKNPVSRRVHGRPVHQNSEHVPVGGQPRAEDHRDGRGANRRPSGVWLRTRRWLYPGGEFLREVRLEASSSAWASTLRGFRQPRHRRRLRRDGEQISTRSGPSGSAHRCARVAARLATTRGPHQILPLRGDEHDTDDLQVCSASGGESPTDGRQ